MEFTGNFEWTLTKSEVEIQLGYEISDEEFVYFSKHFKNNFEAQFEATLEWQTTEWDEVKSWELR
jgi:hypothetical protein